MATRTISDRLVEIRHEMGLSQAKWAKELGLKPHQIRDMERGKTSPSVEMLRRVSENFAVDTDWLLCGEQQSSGKSQAEKMDNDALIRELRRRLSNKSGKTKPVVVWGEQNSDEGGQLTEQYRSVPLMRDAAAAGHGRVVSDDIEGWAVIHESVVPKGHEVRAVRVDGDSMTPLLPSGTIVAVDFDLMDPREANGRIVAARQDEDVMIKWWHIRDDYVALESQNPAYPPIYLSGDEMDRALLGQVVWAWQDLRDVRRRQ